MIETRTPAQKSLTVLNYAIITFFGLLCLYPIIHVLAASLSDPLKLVRHRGVYLWPDGFSLKGYQMVLGNPNIWMGYGNTIFYVVAGTVSKEC